MGEAFITRRGGGSGATIQHITATDAASQTFTLSNPKRSKCLVFGRIYSEVSNYNDWDGTLSSSYQRDCALYGSKYSVQHKETYPYESENFASGQAINFTRNSGSIKITLDSTYPFSAVTQYSGDFYALVRKNVIDIYVVDYD